MSADRGQESAIDRLVVGRVQEEGVPSTKGSAPPCWCVAAAESRPSAVAAHTRRGLAQKHHHRETDGPARTHRSAMIAAAPCPIGRAAPALGTGPGHRGQRRGADRGPAPQFRPRNRSSVPPPKSPRPHNPEAAPRPGAHLGGVEDVGVGGDLDGLVARGGLQGDLEGLAHHLARRASGADAAAGRGASAADADRAHSHGHFGIRGWGLGTGRWECVRAGCARWGCEALTQSYNRRQLLPRPGGPRWGGHRTPPQPITAWRQRGRRPSHRPRTARSQGSLVDAKVLAGGETTHTLTHTGEERSGQTVRVSALSSRGCQAVRQAPWLP